MYQVRAVRTAFLITRDAAQAEDAVQEAFLQIYRSIRHFDPGPPLCRLVHAQRGQCRREDRPEIRPAGRRSGLIRTIPGGKVCRLKMNRSKGRSKAPSSSASCGNPCRTFRPASAPPLSSAITWI